MNLNFNVTIKTEEDENKNAIVNISIESKDVFEYILKRDELINDKIYSDNYELILVKLEHNKKLDKIRMALFEEMYFEVGKCDIAAAKAVKEESEKFYKRQAIRDQKFEEERSEYIQKQNKLEEKINLLMNRIAELESK